MLYNKLYVDCNYSVLLISVMFRLSVNFDQNICHPIQLTCREPNEYCNYCMITSQSNENLLHVQ